MKTDRTLTADLRQGDLTNTLVKLHSDGMDVDDFVAIGKNIELRNDVMQAIMKHRLFTPPEEQISRLLIINEQVWKNAEIAEEAIRKLGDPPICPASDENGLYCVCLFYETGDAVKTFKMNWQALIHVHGEKETWKWDGLLFTPKGVRQHKDAILRKPGLRWQVVELGRLFQKQCVRDVRPQLDKIPKMGMGQELPLIAALHPKWAVSMNGDTIPFVDAPDLEVAPRAKGEFSHAPFLGFLCGHRRVDLSALHVDFSSSRCGSGSLQ